MTTNPESKNVPIDDDLEAARTAAAGAVNAALTGLGYDSEATYYNHFYGHGMEDCLGWLVPRRASRAVGILQGFIDEEVHIPSGAQTLTARTADEILGLLGSRVIIADLVWTYEIMSRADRVMDSAGALHKRYETRRKAKVKDNPDLVNLATAENLLISYLRKIAAQAALDKLQERLLISREERLAAQKARKESREAVVEKPRTHQPTRTAVTRLLEYGEEQVSSRVKRATEIARKAAADIITKDSVLSKLPKDVQEVLSKQSLQSVTGNLGMMVNKATRHDAMYGLLNVATRSLDEERKPLNLRVREGMRTAYSSGAVKDWPAAIARYEGNWKGKREQRGDVSLPDATAHLVSVMRITAARAALEVLGTEITEKDAAKGRDARAR